MVKVTKLTDYGIALMASLASGLPHQQFTAMDLSRSMRLPLPTVRKLLKRLARSGLLESTRGAAGGYCLARDPEEITLLDMVAALEGPLAITECTSGEDCHCALVKICSQKDNWSLINQQFKNTLDGYSLAQMTGSLADEPTPARRN